MTDAQIIDLYWERDPHAIEVTDETYGAKLQRLAQQMLSTEQDAEECVNDTYLGAWNTMPPTRPERLFAYLAGLCRHLVLNRIDWLNAQKRRATVVELTRELELCIPNPQEEQRHRSEEIGQALTAFLRTLPEDARRVFLRRYWYGDGVRDVAERYHISESKVKVMLFRTRNKLREYLEKEEISI